MNKIKFNNIFNKEVNIELVDNIEDANFVTHNGSFHADEVMTLCILSTIFNDIKLFRTTKLSDTNAFVFDMGGGEFDHHGKDFNKTRENGVKYASCGLVWKAFGKSILKDLGIENIDEMFEFVDKDLVCDIDRFDNGQNLEINTDYSVKSIPSLIESFNPNFDEPDKEKEYFLNSVLFANKIFTTELKNTVAKEKARTVIDKKINESTDDFIELDCHIDWKNLVLSSKEEKASRIKYAIVPSPRGGYVVGVTPIFINSFDLRKPLPSSWGGKSKEELFELTGIDTLYFCHKNLFICACDTREDALKIVRMAIDNKEYDEQLPSENSFGQEKKFVKKLSNEKNQ